MSLGRSGLHIGGFSTLELEVPKGQTGKLELDTINFLILFEPNDVLRGFMELEVGEIFEVDFDTGEVHSSPSFNFERLSGDLMLSNAINARFGKFQTPVGRWNLVPAEPLVWTATEPLLVETFAETQTGAMAFGTFFVRDSLLSYWLYGQFVDAFDVDRDSPHDVTPDRSAGGRIEFAETLEGWSIGASFLASKRGAGWNYLGGVDGRWKIGPLEATMEFIYQDGAFRSARLWDIYLQAVYEVVPTLYLVARYEHSSPLGRRRAANLGDFGIAWVPRHFLRLKATYRTADRLTFGDPEGFKADFSVLF